MEQQDLLRPSYGGQQNLPNATASLVLGIISIVSIICYGFGIVFGIIGLVLANKDRRLYRAEPELYTASSYSSSNGGRICSIIGIILSALFILVIAGVIIFSVMLSKNKGWN